MLFCDLGLLQKIGLQLFKKYDTIDRAVEIPLLNKHRTNAVESRLKMKTTKQLNRTTDKTGVKLAKIFFDGLQANLTAAQTTDLLNYVKRLATGHAFKRYYYGDLNNPPQAEYIDDLTQTALLALFDGKTTRYKKLTNGAKTVITTLQGCKTTVDKNTDTKKHLTDVQAFRRFIYIAFNDYNYNERSVTATIGKRKAMPLELTADSDVDEMVYITDTLDFIQWAENELNGLHAMHLTTDDIKTITKCFNKLTKDKQHYLRFVMDSPLCRKSATAEYNRRQRVQGKKTIDGMHLQHDLIVQIQRELNKDGGIHSTLLIELCKHC